MKISKKDQKELNAKSAEVVAYRRAMDLIVGNLSKAEDAMWEVARNIEKRNRGKRLIKIDHGGKNARLIFAEDDN